MKPILVMSIPWLEANSVHKTASGPFVVRNIKGLVNGKQKLLWSDPVCLPSVYLMSSHMTRSPRTSPYLHTASDQRLEAGMAWEQGYSGPSL